MADNRLYRRNKQMITKPEDSVMLQNLLLQHQPNPERRVVVIDDENYAKPIKRNSTFTFPSDAIVTTKMVKPNGSEERKMDSEEKIESSGKRTKMISKKGNEKIEEPANRNS